MSSKAKGNESEPLRKTVDFVHIVSVAVILAGVILVVASPIVIAGVDIGSIDVATLPIVAITVIPVDIAPIASSVVPALNLDPSVPFTKYMLISLTILDRHRSSSRVYLTPIVAQPVTPQEHLVSCSRHNVDSHSSSIRSVVPPLK